jgi:hypothetical protein
MEQVIVCQEKTGLFLIDSCRQSVAGSCTNCGKHICREHTFSQGEETTESKVCLTCKTAFDPRLTSQIELYSGDRAIWRKKMALRFHQEYPYLVAMASKYDALFDSYRYPGYHDSSSNNSFFES